MSKNADNLKNAKRRTPEDIEQEVSQLCAKESSSIRRIIANVPPKYRLSYARALFLEGKRALAVRMKCVECVGFESVKERVGNCNCRTCPLWLHRPFQNETEQELGED